MSEEEIQHCGASVDDEDESLDSRRRPSKFSSSIDCTAILHLTEKQDHHRHNLTPTNSSSMDLTKKKNRTSRLPILQETVQLSSRELRKINKQIELIDSQPAVIEKEKPPRKKIAKGLLSKQQQQMSGKKSPRSDSSLESEQPRRPSSKKDFDVATPTAATAGSSFISGFHQIDMKPAAGGFQQDRRNSSGENIDEGGEQRMNSNIPSPLMHPRISISFPAAVAAATAAAAAAAAASTAGKTTADIIVMEDDSEMSGSESPLKQQSSSQAVVTAAADNNSPLMIDTFASMNGRVTPSKLSPGVVTSASVVVHPIIAAAAASSPPATTGRTRVSGRSKNKLRRQQHQAAQQILESGSNNHCQQLETCSSTSAAAAASACQRQRVTSSYASSSSLSHDSGSHNNFEVISTISEVNKINGRQSISSALLTAAATTVAATPIISIAAVTSLIQRKPSIVIAVSGQPPKPATPILSEVVANAVNANIITIQTAAAVNANVQAAAAVSPVRLPANTPVVKSLVSNSSSSQKNIIYLQRKSIDEGGAVSVRTMQPQLPPQYPPTNGQLQQANSAAAAATATAASEQTPQISGIKTCGTLMRETRSSSPPPPSPLVSSASSVGGGTQLPLLTATSITSHHTSISLRSVATSAAPAAAESEVHHHSDQLIGESVHHANAATSSSSSNQARSKKAKKKEKLAAKEEAKQQQLQLAVSAATTSEFTFVEANHLEASSPLTPQTVEEHRVKNNSLSAEQQPQAGGNPPLTDAAAVVVVAPAAESLSQKAILLPLEQQAKSLPLGRRFDADYCSRLKRGPLNFSAFEDQSEMFIKLNDYHESHRRERELTFGKYADDLLDQAAAAPPAAFPSSPALPSVTAVRATPPVPPAAVASAPLFFKPDNVKEAAPKMIKGDVAVAESEDTSNQELRENPPVASTGTASLVSKVRLIKGRADLFEKTAILQDRLQKKFKNAQYPQDFHRPFSSLHDDFARTYMNNDYCSTLLAFFNLQSRFETISQTQQVLPQMDIEY